MSFSNRTPKVVIVSKKDGSLRFCINYRPLNSVTKKIAYLFMKIEKDLDALEEFNYFSLLDFKKAY
jgi:hypothetical protein